MKMRRESGVDDGIKTANRDDLLWWRLIFGGFFRESVYLICWVKYILNMELSRWILNIFIDQLMGQIIWLRMFVNIACLLYSLRGIYLRWRGGMCWNCLWFCLISIRWILMNQCIHFLIALRLINIRICACRLINILICASELVNILFCTNGLIYILFWV